MEEKIDRILTLLDDPNIGICSRLRTLEKTVNGNGKPGLAEQVRVSSRNWAIFCGVITLAMPIVFKYWIK